jgi:FKBP-type peptidyl-prolyl cis-trans isomerase FkpA
VSCPQFARLTLSAALLLQTAAAQAPAAPKAAPAAKPSAAAAPKPAAPKAAAPKPAAPKPAVPKPAASKSAAAKPVPKGAAVIPATDEEKTIYAVGLSMHRSLASFDLSDAEVALIRQAIADAAAKKPAVVIEEWGPKIQGLAAERQQRAAQREKTASTEYLAKAAQQPGAEKTESGIVYRQITPGTGASPKASDTVRVHYRGTLTNGTEFDSSYKRNQPAEFPLSGVIPCWTEGVQKMKVGEKAMLVCPSNLAYGDQGRPTIPGGAALIFEIELLEIVAAK